MVGRKIHDHLDHRRVFGCIGAADFVAVAVADGHSVGALGLGDLHVDAVVSLFRRGEVHGLGLPFFRNGEAVHGIQKLRSSGSVVFEAACETTDEKDCGKDAGADRAGLDVLLGSKKRDAEQDQKRSDAGDHHKSAKERSGDAHRRGRGSHILACLVLQEHDRDRGCIQHAVHQDRKQDVVLLYDDVGQCAAEDEGKGTAQDRHVVDREHQADRDDRDPFMLDAAEAREDRASVKCFFADRREKCHDEERADVVHISVEKRSEFSGL